KVRGGRTARPPRTALHGGLLSGIFTRGWCAGPPASQPPLALGTTAGPTDPVEELRREFGSLVIVRLNRLGSRSRSHSRALFLSATASINVQHRLSMARPNIEAQSVAITPRVAG